MKLHRRAEHTLQQRIMQFLRHMRAFGEALFKANVEHVSQAVHPDAVNQQRCQPDAEYTPQAKPPRLPKCRFNLKPDRSLRTIPQSIAVASHHTKSITTRSQVTVRGFPVGYGFAPTMIEAVQPVTIANVLRIAQTQPDISKRRSLPRR